LIAGFRSATSPADESCWASRGRLRFGAWRCCAALRTSSRKRPAHHVTINAVARCIARCHTQPRPAPASGNPLP